MMREAVIDSKYLLGEVIELQIRLQDRLRQIREEHPVQANAALAVHRNCMRVAHGKTLGEPGLTDQERDRLLETNGLAMTLEEQKAFGDTLNILLLMATISNRKIDPAEIRESIEILSILPTDTSNETN